MIQMLDANCRCLFSCISAQHTEPQLVSVPETYWWIHTQTPVWLLNSNLASTLAQVANSASFLPDGCVGKAVSDILDKQPDQTFPLHLGKSGFSPLRNIHLCKMISSHVQLVFVPCISETCGIEQVALLDS